MNIARSWDLRDREERLARLGAGVLILGNGMPLAEEEYGEGKFGRIARDVLRWEKTWEITRGRGFRVNDCE